MPALNHKKTVFAAFVLAAGFMPMADAAKPEALPVKPAALPVPESKPPAQNPSLSGAAIPHGYRRTVNGWEDASQWGIVENDPAAIEHWMQVQRNREPQWARRTLEQIRTTSPAIVALVQVLAITVILRAKRWIANAHAPL